MIFKFLFLLKELIHIQPQIRQSHLITSPNVMYWHIMRVFHKINPQARDSQTRDEHHPTTTFLIQGQGFLWWGHTRSLVKTCVGYVFMSSTLYIWNRNHCIFKELHDVYLTSTFICQHKLRKWTEWPWRRYVYPNF